ncbi:hypothetical protein [Actinoplanes sp. NPDC026623]|uniref:hypothetical protein n=1 Tax=Actinoplanes sp. NPDC026623 TaxID=3155610 RepID=UPI00340EC467
MTVEPESNEPNEFGFSGAATGPEPAPDLTPVDGESIAIPAGDLTGTLSDALEEAVAPHEDDAG